MSDERTSRYESDADGATAPDQERSGESSLPRMLRQQFEGAFTPGVVVASSTVNDQPVFGP